MVAVKLFWVCVLLFCLYFFIGDIAAISYKKRKRSREPDTGTNEWTERD